MTEHDLLQQLRNAPESLVFADIIAVIDSHYAFSPAGFRNGDTYNDAGQNNGSCKVFAFARLHQLDAATTLGLFAEHYRAVLATPEGSDHANIRNFMRSGWDGIQFDDTPLMARA